MKRLEIEAKVRNGSTVLMYGPALRKCDHSKLATGKAIEKLLSASAKGLLDSNSNPQPVVYEKIDGYLKCRSV